MSQPRGLTPSQPKQSLRFTEQNLGTWYRVSLSTRAQAGVVARVCMLSLALALCLLLPSALAQSEWTCYNDTICGCVSPFTPPCTPQCPGPQPHAGGLRVCHGCPRLGPG